MRKACSWLALLLLLAPSGSSSHKPPTLLSDQVVCWLKTRKLTWADFQAPKKPKLTEYTALPNSYLAATTEADAVVYDQTNLAGQYLGSVVSVQFSKRKSWIDKDYFFDRSATLAHEQLHFDIVELTGRKIRQRLAGYATAPGRSYYSPEHDAEIGCLYDEESDLQLLFDHESKAGNDLKAQARWQAYIQRELNKLRQFESTEKDCMTP